MSTALAPYGWGTERETGLAAATSGGDQTLRPGRVARVDRGECDVVTAHGVERAASDQLRSQDAVAPVTGDWVTLRSDPDAGVVIDTVLPRQSAIVRKDPADGATEQVLVANVDVVAITHGLDRPFNLGRVERLLVLAWDTEAEPVVVLTKADLADAKSDLDEVIATLAETQPDIAVHVTSASDGEGIDGLRELLGENRTMVLLGESGAGKSSLVNALVGEEVQETGTVRVRDHKGRHTTTARELIRVPTGGVLIDTPGIRAIGLWDARPALDRVFADLLEYAPHCRFADCSHGVEPGCAVKEAVEQGLLDRARYERYQRLRRELVELEEEREQQAWQRRPRRHRR